MQLMFVVKRGEDGRFKCLICDLELESETLMVSHICRKHIFLLDLMFVKDQYVFSFMEQKNNDYKPAESNMENS